MKRDMSCETIERVYRENKSSVSLMEFRTGISREKIIEKLDEFERKYNEESFLKLPQKNDKVLAEYEYRTKIYKVLGIISKKYSNSFRLEVIGGDTLPEELLAAIIVPMKAKIDIIERDMELDMEVEITGSDVVGV